VNAAGASSDGGRGCAEAAAAAGVAAKLTAEAFGGRDIAERLMMTDDFQRSKKLNAKSCLLFFHTH
jgi:hypothetical protein